MTISQPIPQQLLALIYADAPAALDEVARRCGAADWAALTSGLAFESLHTAEASDLYTAQASALTLALTVDDPELPVGQGGGWLGLEDAFGSEVYWALLLDGRIAEQGGELAQA